MIVNTLVYSGFLAVEIVYRHWHNAETFVNQRKLGEVRPEHVLNKILEYPMGNEYRIFNELVPHKMCLITLNASLDINRPCSPEEFIWDDAHARYRHRRTLLMLEAARAASSAEDKCIDSICLLLGIIRAGGLASDLLARLGITEDPVELAGVRMGAPIKPLKPIVRKPVYDPSPD